MALKNTLFWKVLIGSCNKRNVFCKSDYKGRVTQFLSSCVAYRPTFRAYQVKFCKLEMSVHWKKHLCFRFKGSWQTKLEEVCVIVWRRNCTNWFLVVFFCSTIWLTVWWWQSCLRGALIWCSRCQSALTGKSHKEILFTFTKKQKKNSTKFSAIYWTTVFRFKMLNDAR